MEEPPSQDASSQDRLTGALKSKRKSLDQEIDDFKARKDEEFRQYEEELSNEVRAESAQQVSDGTASRGTRMIVKKASDTRLKCSRPESNRPSAAEAIGSHRRDDLSNFNSYQPATPPLTSASTKAPSQLDGERELELRSLFTPSYLPLFESRAGPNNHARTSTSTDDPNPSTASTSIPASCEQSHQHSTNPLSSTLTTLPSTVYDPTSTPQSDRAPRPQLAERRASSSPSGGNLRSSLRSPERPPRERKHVLFSIDNKVMSPSSSPLAQRSGGPGEPRKKKGSKGGGGGESGIGEGGSGAGAEGVAEASRKRKKKKAPSAAEEQPTTNTESNAEAEASTAAARAPATIPILPSASEGPGTDPDAETETAPHERQAPRVIPLAQPKLVSPSQASFPRSYRDLIEPTVAPTAAELAADEFDGAAGTDPLFDFDEDNDDIGRGAAASASAASEEHEPAEKEQGKGKGKVRSGGTGEGDEDEVPSPGAGSLPIEILRPGRSGG